MHKAILAILIKSAKNLVAMLLTERMIFWALEVASSKTSTKVDDYLVAAVKAAYHNDEDELKKAIEDLSKYTMKKL